MARWRVGLEGDKLDLEDLPDLFTSPNLQVVEEEGAYYLESASFEAQDEGGAVHEEAQRVLPMINGAARLRSRSYRNVAIGSHVVEFGVGGSGKHHQVIVADTLTIRTKANAVLIKVGEEEPEPPEPGSQDTDKWLELAANDKDVAEALSTWGSKPHDWFRLYKVFEIVRSRANIRGAIGQVPPRSSGSPGQRITLSPRERTPDTPVGQRNPPRGR